MSERAAKSGLTDNEGQLFWDPHFASLCVNTVFMLSKTNQLLFMQKKRRVYLTQFPVRKQIRKLAVQGKIRFLGYSMWRLEI